MAAGGGIRMEFGVWCGRIFGMWIKWVWSGLERGIICEVIRYGWVIIWGCYYVVCFCGCCVKV